MNFYSTLAVLVWVVSGFYGMILCTRIIDGYFGLIGVVISWTFFPITDTVIPWYELAVNSNWFPVQVIYGGMFCALVLGGIGEIIKGSKT